MRRRFVFWLLLLSVLSVPFLAASCGTTWPRRDPTGEMFPSVSGTSLQGEDVQLPDALAGAPALLAIGYEQDAQFDLDRWFQGLDMAGGKVRALEVPTIPGWIPNLISGTIDSGMRRGIPEEDWAGVVTVYGDAPVLAEFTGNENGLTGRILLLDATGKVVFFHDRGFSVGAVTRQLAELRALQ